MVYEPLQATIITFPALVGFSPLLFPLDTPVASCPWLLSTPFYLAQVLFVYIFQDRQPLSASSRIV